MVMDAIRRAATLDQGAQRTAIADRAKELLRIHEAEMQSKDGTDGHVGFREVHTYLRGRQTHPSLPTAPTPELRRLAAMSRVNVLELIVASTAQALYVDGYRTTDEQGLLVDEDDPAWEAWQQNRMDARQTGIHRAALAYGAAFATVLPGDSAPVIKGYSPRRMVAEYGDDEDWPVRALAIEPSRGEWILRLFDAESVHVLASKDATGNAGVEYLDSYLHGGAGFPPVVRYLNVVDLDEDHMGEVERLIPIQDQIDDTTFSLLVAQRYSAFRQRYIIGWTAPDENTKVKASAARLWTFDDGPDEVKIGEFEQTELKGYLDSREASLRHAATISQTPAHELIGQMVNISAEALVAAEAGQRRKVTERQMSFGESHEQTLGLCAHLLGVELDTTAQVRWRDTESRSLSATVDALGKMAKMLGIPAQALWERVPGVTQQDIATWTKALEQGDSVARFTALLEAQQRGGGGAGNEPAGDGGAA